MTKTEFLRVLERSLSGSPQVKAEIIGDYEEHFRMGLAAGKTEEGIAASLGDPKAIAKAYHADTLVEKARTEKSAGNIVRAAFAVISLSFFNLVFVSGIFFGLLGALIGLWAAGVAITLSGLAVFLAALFSPVLPWLMTDLPAVTVVGTGFIGLGLLALGLLACLGLYYATIGAYKLVVKYLRLNLGIIKGSKG